MDTWGHIPGTVNSSASHPEFLWCCLQSHLDPADLHRQTRQALQHAGTVLGSGAVKAPWPLPHWKKAGGVPRAAVGARSWFLVHMKLPVGPWAHLDPVLEEETHPENRWHPETRAWLGGNTEPHQPKKLDMSHWTSAVLRECERRSPTGTPLTHQGARTCGQKKGAKSELWLAGPDEHWAAASCQETRLKTLTAGSGEQRRGETEQRGGEGLRSALSEGCRIHTHRRWSLHSRRTLWRTNHLLLQKMQKIKIKIMDIKAEVDQKLVVKHHLWMQRAWMCHCQQAGWRLSYPGTGWPCCRMGSPGWMWASPQLDILWTISFLYAELKHKTFWARTFPRWTDVPLEDSFTILLVDRLRCSTLVTLDMDRFAISQFVPCHTHFCTIKSADCLRGLKLMTFHRILPLPPARQQFGLVESYRLARNSFHPLCLHSACPLLYPRCPLAGRWRSPSLTAGWNHCLPVQIQFQIKCWL